MTVPSRPCLRCLEPAPGARCARCGLTLRVRDFTTERVLSENDHSRLYLARQDSGQRVALKELLFATVPSAKELDAFEREGAILEQLRHPNIPRFVARFVDGTGAQSRLYIAQQFVEGESLTQTVARGPLGEAEALGIVRQVLQVLRFLHSRQPKVIHRDIKPANLIRDPRGRLWLVDFGAARLLERLETQQGTVVGTFGYMPVEQFTGALDETSDLYALGATLLLLVSGREPAAFMQPNLRLKVDATLPVSGSTRQVLEKLLAPARERYRNAAEVLAALDSSPVRARQWPSTRPVLSAVACGVVLLASFGVTRYLQRVFPILVPSIQRQVMDDEGGTEQVPMVLINSDAPLEIPRDHPGLSDPKAPFPIRDTERFDVQGDFVIPGPLTIRLNEGCQRYQTVHLTGAGFRRELGERISFNQYAVNGYAYLIMMGTTRLEEYANCETAARVVLVEERRKVPAGISSYDQGVYYWWRDLELTDKPFNFAVMDGPRVVQVLQIDRKRGKLLGSPPGAAAPSGPTGNAGH